MTDGPALSELLHRGDLDELVREVDRLAAQRSWEALLVLRDRCHAAAEELGKQLWGPAQYAEYRIALEAPAPVAARVVVPGAARFALGPLTEVVAQEHDFASVADHLDAPVAAVVAQERILRGEDLTDHPAAGVEDTGLPPALQPWEPRYALPTYRPTERIDGSPSIAGLGAPRSVTSAPGRPRAEPAAVRAALIDLVAPWEATSEGQVHVALVDGDAEAAVAAVVPGAARLRPIDLPSAFAAMAWAAASGGAYGRRRGAAAGRAAAWWVGHALTGLAFPAEPDELEFHLEELTCHLVEPVPDGVGDVDAPDEIPSAGGDASTGWHLRLAIADRRAGWAVALDAFDPPPDGVT